MLTEHQINMLPERIAQRLQRINTEYLESVGRVLKEIGELRPSDVHRLQQLYNYGADLQRITYKLAEASNKNVQDIYDIFDVVAKENYSYSQPFYKATGKAFIPYEDNEDLQRYVQSLAKQTAGEYVNLTQHTAFAVFDSTGKHIAPLYEADKIKAATTLSDTYTQIVDYAVTKAQLGGDGYQKAVQDVCRAMVHSGIKTVDYATGYKRRLESAVRQNVLWGIKQCNQNTADMIGEDFGADGYEISYHSNPRPSHADMAGKIYAIGRARTVNGIYYPSFSDVAHLLEEYGCLHFKFSVLLGISEPAYTREQLEELKAQDGQMFDFEGETYTRQKGKELQGRLESAMVQQKELATMAEAAGDEELRCEAQGKLNLLSGKYARLSKESGLPTKTERMKAATVKGLDKPGNSGIIKEDKLGTELWTEEKRIKIRQTEKILSGNKYETAVVYDENGDVVFKKKGDSSSVKFTKIEIKQMKGKVVTHNHPNDSCFSSADIDMLRKAKVCELRAAASDGTYVLRYSGTWNNNYNSLAKIKDRYYEIDEEISKGYAEIAAREGKTIFDYDREIQEKTIAKLSKEIGIVFSKEN